MPTWGTTDTSNDEPSSELLYAPWTTEQVVNLNRWQSAGAFHPFTCGGEIHNGERKPTLIAAHDGWLCPDSECSYRQGWAHVFMAEERSIEWWEQQVGGFRSFLAEREQKQHHRLITALRGSEQQSSDLIDAACEVLHDAYEQAALETGWETNPASRRPWGDVPDANKATMRSAVQALLDWLGGAG